MQLPQLLGSDYILPAILVVIVLGGLLGLLVLRQRHQKRVKAANGEQPQKLSKAEKAALKAGAKPEKATRETRKATALAAKAEREALEVAGLPLEGELSDEGALPGGQGPVEAGAAEAGVAAAVMAGAPASADAVAPAEPASAMAATGRRRTAGKPPAETSPMAALAVDPLQKVLTSILQGWGDITAEDTNRLNVFRRERVIAALAAIEPPKEGKANEYVRTRLTQLRRYAGQMEQAERPAPPSVEQHEFVGIGLGPAPAVTNVAGTAAAAATAAGAAAVSAAFTQQEEPAQATPKPRKSWYSSEVEEEITAAAEPEIKIIKSPPMPREWTTSPTGVDLGEEEVSAGQERAAEFDWGVGEEELAAATDPVKAVDLSWTHEPAVTTPAEPAPAPAPATMPAAVAPAPVAPAPEPAAFRPPAFAVPESIDFFAPTTPAPPVQAVPAPAPAATPAAPPDEAKAPWGADAASRGAEAAVAAAAAAFWDSEDAPKMERSAAGLGQNVTNAADLLKLPAGEQVEMLAFLSPGELVKAFRSAGNIDVKKGVIDTLEHIANTDSLNAIHACLDDQDPAIQLYALDAAERMLGKS